MNILYIEDNHINRRVLEVGLKQIAQVTGIEDGFVGIEKAKATNFDVILVDLNLNDPNLDGFGVIKALRDEAKIPALYAAVTAYVGDDWENKCYDAGFDWYITKPIDLTILIERLKQYAAAT